MSKFIEITNIETNDIVLVNVEHIRLIFPMYEGTFFNMSGDEELRCSDDYNDVKKFLTSS